MLPALAVFPAPNSPPLAAGWPNDGVAAAGAPKAGAAGAAEPKPPDRAGEDMRAPVKGEPGTRYGQRGSSGQRRRDRPCQRRSTHRTCSSVGLAGRTQVPTALHRMSLLAAERRSEGQRRCLDDGEERGRCTSCSHRMSSQSSGARLATGETHSSRKYRLKPRRQTGRRLPVAAAAAVAAAAVAGRSHRRSRWHQTWLSCGCLSCVRRRGGAERVQGRAVEARATVDRTGSRGARGSYAETLYAEAVSFPSQQQRA